MYDQNPTLEALGNTPLGEERQGEVFALPIALEKPASRHFYIESYGCQMNFSDSEIVASILGEAGFAPTRDMHAADLLLVNTCSIREKAEDTVRKRLQLFNKIKQGRPSVLVGVLGCMAERLKAKLLEEEKIVDIVVGPDAYRDLPKLVATADDGGKGINVLLSREETYADISPLRLDSNGISGFISIMRGCDNMCSFCVVPFTRGRERSRDPESIVNEARDLFERGYREVTLLGQNVDSYKYKGEVASATLSHQEEASATLSHQEEASATLSKQEEASATLSHQEEVQREVVFHFHELLERVALIDPKLRVRFSTSHPKDMTDDVCHVMNKHENICKYIHLPVQSGNSRVLELMNRTYDREWYMDRVKRIYEIVPDVAISSDIITGFCSETEEEHRDTLEMIEWAKYTMSYMFFYSERPGTLAARKYADDIPEEVKKRRLAEVITKQREVSHAHNLTDLGKVFEVLIEGDSKKSNLAYKGRNSQNKMIIFDKHADYKPGDYAMVRVTDCTSAALLGELVL
jgi:tRNA-2-methylthio-N6-dimethylallyladenosine synthase